MYELGYTKCDVAPFLIHVDSTAPLNVSRAEDLTRIRNLRSQRGIGHSEDLTRRGTA